MEVATGPVDDLQDDVVREIEDRAQVDHGDVDRRLALDGCRNPTPFAQASARLPSHGRGWFGVHPTPENACYGPLTTWAIVNYVGIRR